MPLLTRIEAATIAAPNLAAAALPYQKLFGFEVVERAPIDPALALSWGAPNASGRNSLTLAAGSNFIRLVETDHPPGFKPITTLGWNSIELAAHDPDAVHANMESSGFRVIGAPAQLAAFPTVRATQAIGPSGEAVHLTSETGPSVFVPKTDTPVGRIFITVLAVADVAAVTDWYATNFTMAKNPIRRGPISTINNAQGLKADHPHDATFLALSEHASFVELWGFDGASAVARPRALGQLPPGVAMASFTVPDLSALAFPWFAPPAVRNGAIYRGRRAATFIGPASELIELIEDR